MTDTIEGAFRGAAGSIEHLVRVIVRQELREHLGPEGDHLINVKSAPMSANKLRRLVRSGELRGYKHGKDTFISASDFRALIEGRPFTPPPKPIVVPEPHPDAEHDGMDDTCLSLGIVPGDPAEYRAFEARIARRRAEGGERAATLLRVEQEIAAGEALRERKAKAAATRAAKSAAERDIEQQRRREAGLRTAAGTRRKAALRAQGKE